jgi:hypothetical protein
VKNAFILLVQNPELAVQYLARSTHLMICGAAPVGPMNAQAIWHQLRIGPRANGIFGLSRWRDGRCSIDRPGAWVTEGYRDSSSATDAG